MITPIEVAMQKVLEVMAKSGLSGIVKTFEDNEVLDPQIITLHKTMSEDSCEQDVKNILRKKREASTLQDFLKESLETANAEFTQRMAAINIPTFAPRPLMIGDASKKKRKKSHKKRVKG